MGDQKCGLFGSFQISKYLAPLLAVPRGDGGGPGGKWDGRGWLGELIARAPDTAAQGGHPSMIRSAERPAF